jgi:hypothetical protein
MILPFPSRRLPTRVSPALLEHRAAASNEICGRSKRTSRHCKRREAINVRPADTARANRQAGGGGIVPAILLIY